MFQVQVVWFILNFLALLAGVLAFAEMVHN